MKTRVVTCGICVLALAGIATAGVTPIGPFTGQISEDWESFDNYNQNPNFYEDANGPVSIFGGNAMISSPFSGQGGIMAIYEPGSADFGLGANGLAQVADGTKGMGLDTPTSATIDFSSDISDFGGYWGAADPVINFEFYDAGGLLIGTDTVSYSDPAGQGTLIWLGWTFNTGIASITYSGGFVVNDGLQANVLPSPGALAILALGGLVGTRRRRN